jgi:hypothetical protein
MSVNSQLRNSSPQPPGSSARLNLTPNNSPARLNSTPTRPANLEEPSKGQAYPQFRTPVRSQELGRTHLNSPKTPVHKRTSTDGGTGGTSASSLNSIKWYEADRGSPLETQSASVGRRTAHNIAADPIDDLTASLSRAHIGVQPKNQISRFPKISSSLRTWVDTVPPLSLSNSSVDGRNDEVTHVVKSVLSAELRVSHTNVLITPDHPCFAPARTYCERWGIPEQALENFIDLACGSTKFPFLLLLNPSNGHEELCFTDMVEASPTLKWIYDTLEENGLNIADVSILDICPLLSSKRLHKMGDVSENAVEEAYGLIEGILKMTKPKIVISCQCATRGVRKWKAAQNTIAYQLCSSVTGAKAGLVNVVKLEDHEIEVIQGFHPMYILYEKDDYKRQPTEKILKELLQRVYSPCASWKAEAELLTCMDTAIANLLLSSERLVRAAKSGETVSRNTADYKTEFLDHSGQSKAAIDRAFETFLGRLGKVGRDERQSRPYLGTPSRYS